MCLLFKGGKRAQFPTEKEVLKVLGNVIKLKETDSRKSELTSRPMYQETKSIFFLPKWLPLKY